MNFSVAIHIKRKPRIRSSEMTRSASHARNSKLIVHQSNTQIKKPSHSPWNNQILHRATKSSSLDDKIHLELNTGVQKSVAADMSWSHSSGIQMSLLGAMKNCWPHQMKNTTLLSVTTKKLFLSLRMMEWTLAGKDLTHENSCGQPTCLLVFSYQLQHQQNSSVNKSNTLLQLKVCSVNNN